MRSTPIIQIIRRYGLSSRRLSPKAHIKYEDAIKQMTQYESASLKIDDVIDNGLFPNKSISCHCQMPGCNHKIRYEYVLKNKVSGEKIVAGSTCVWPALGFSELQVKEFKDLEKVLKEHHALVEWSNDHPDILEKLARMRQEGLSQFRPFWEEVEVSRLTDEDTDYIASIDVDKVLEDREKEKQRRAARQAELRAYMNASASEKQKMDEDYQRVLEGLNCLIKAYPENAFYQSLQAQSERRKLTGSQIRCIKLDRNLQWYNEHIKGTPKDIMGQCDSIIVPIMRKFNQVWTAQGNNKFLEEMNQIISTMDAKVKLAWSLMKVKNKWVIC